MTTTTTWVTYAPLVVKSKLLDELRAHLDGLFESAEAGASDRVLVLEVWGQLLKFGPLPREVLFDRVMDHTQIEDTGVGVPDELGWSIFEPYITSRRGKGGSGLGLHVSRRIVREMGADRVRAAHQPWHAILDRSATKHILIRMQLPVLPAHRIIRAYDIPEARPRSGAVSAGMCPHTVIFLDVGRRSERFAGAQTHRRRLASQSDAPRPGAARSTG